MMMKVTRLLRGAFWCIGVGCVTAHAQSPKVLLEPVIVSFDESALEKAAALLPPGPERALAEGVIASRTGNGLLAEKRLDEAVAGLGSSPAELAVALQYQAYAAAQQNEYGKAARAGRAMLGSPPPGLLANDLIDFGNLQSAWNVLRDQPPQTVELHGSATPTRVANAFGRVEAVVTANGTAMTALFDTGDETGAISESHAEQLHLKSLPGRTKIEGAAQVSMDARMAMLDTLQVGSALLHHVPLTIVPDQTFRIGPPGKQTQQIDMFFGLSEMRALRHMTISENGSLTFNAAPTPAPVEGRLLEQGFIPILQASVDGVGANLLIDCGADVTLMNSTFRQRVPVAFSGLTESSMRFSGVGGAGHAERFVLPQLTLRLKRGSVTMHSVTAFAESSEINFAGLVGDIGRDF